MRIELFGSKGCVPCGQQKIVLAKFAAKHPKVVIKEHDLDTEEGFALASRYGIKGIPTCVFIDQGEVCSVESGLLSLDALQKVLGAIEKMKS